MNVIDAIKLQDTPSPELKSSLTSLQSIIYSIMLLDNKETILNKIASIETAINLNDIEKQIIKEIKTSVDTLGVVNADFVKEKFSYYFNLSPLRVIGADKIDFAITDNQISQARDALSNELMRLASGVTSMGSDEIKGRLQEITNESILTTAKVREIENGLQKSENPYEDFASKSGEFSLLLPEIEQSAGKAAKGHIVTILGFTGSFKTVAALNIAYQNALAGKNVLYLSLESTEKEMINRIVLNHIAVTAENRQQLINQNDLRDRKLLQSQINHYNKKYNETVDLLSNHFVILDSLKFEYNTFIEMTNTLRIIDNQFLEKTGKGLEMLIVDQVSLLKYTKGGGKKATYDGALINDWVVYFGKQALNFLDENNRSICVVNLAQVRREAYLEASKKKNKGRYDASAASDSHEIERTSDTIITLYKDLDVKNTLLVHVPKARHGATFDEPLQVEVYGDYFHIGSLDNFASEQITPETFESSDFDLTNLLKMK